jgi:lysyl-tRNA synthetase class I
MIPNHTPGIGTSSYPLYHLERLGSLVDEVTHEIEMILWSELYPVTEFYELIIATMDITDENRSLLHEKSI